MKLSHWNALHSHASAVTAMPVCFAMQPLNHQLCSCRPSKPVRDLDMIMQKEQQIAAVVTRADADKVIAAFAEGIAPAATAQIDLTAAPAQTASTLAQPSPPIEELQEQCGTCLHSATANK